MPDKKQDQEKKEQQRKAAAAAGPTESDAPRPTPGSAEGDRETVEEDLEQKFGEKL
jgi:hypothetical protein